MRICASLACVLAAAALTGCACNDKKSEAAKPAATTTASVKTVNTVCPIGGDDFGNSPSAVRTVKGTSVGFCCDHCTAKFDKMSDAEKDNVVNLAKANKVVGH